MEAGHDVIVAKGGREGIALVDGMAPDLVITDILMPDKDGIETIRDLRAKGCRLQIIAMTGAKCASGLDYLSLAQRFGANKDIGEALHRRRTARHRAELSARLSAGRPLT
jgi:CheY-like chemotaxis protein